MSDHDAAASSGGASGGGGGGPKGQKRTIADGSYDAAAAPVAEETEDRASKRAKKVAEPAAAAAAAAAAATQVREADFGTISSGQVARAAAERRALPLSGLDYIVMRCFDEVAMGLTASTFDRDQSWLASVSEAEVGLFAIYWDEDHPDYPVDCSPERVIHSIAYLYDHGAIKKVIVDGKVQYARATAITSHARRHPMFNEWLASSRIIAMDASWQFDEEGVRPLRKARAETLRYKQAAVDAQRQREQAQAAAARPRVQGEFMWYNSATGLPAW